MPSIGGFPIHNYGTDPIASAMSNIYRGWETERIAEEMARREALQKLLDRQASAYPKLAEAGQWGPDMAEGAGGFYTPDIVRGMGAQAEQVRVAKQMQQSQQMAELLAKGEQNRQTAIDNAFKSLDTILKKKDEFTDLPPEMFNNMIAGLQKGLADGAGVQVDLSQIATAQDAQKAKQQLELERFHAAWEKFSAAEDPRDKDKFAAQLATHVGILTKEGMPKEAFTLQADAIKTWQGERIKEFAKPKTKKVERTVDLGGRQRIFYGDGTTEDVPKTPAPQAAGADQTNAHKQWQEYNASLARDGKPPMPFHQFYTEVYQKFDLMRSMFGGAPPPAPGAGLPVPSGAPQKPAGNATAKDYIDKVLKNRKR